MPASKFTISLLLAAPFLSAGTTPTTITVATSVNPSVYGHAVTLTATVSPAAATGIVTFYSGVTVLETEPLTGGKATVSTVLLDFGAQSIKAFYSGNSTFAASTSAVVTQTVTAVAGNGFLAPAYVGQPPFAPPSIVIADFNGDLKPDVAALEDTSGVVTVSVFLGVGNGTFQTPVTSEDPSNGCTIAVGDFNGDGIPDLALPGCSSVTSPLDVMIGNGDGTFQPPQPTGAVGFAEGVVVGDFNQDGKADIAFVSVDPGDPEGSLGILLGDGDGTFQPPQFYGLGADYPPVVAADFNGDGKTDIALITEGSSTYNGIAGVMILLGNGDGTFQTPTTFAADLYGAGLAAWDVNADGKVDLIYGATFEQTCGSVSCINVALGNGDGTFQPAVAYPTGGGTGAIGLDDFNGDGRPDIAAGNGGSMLSVLLGNGDGTFQAPLNYSYSGSGFVLADINGDGRADVAFISSAPLGEFGVLLGAGPLTTTDLTSSVNPSTYGKSVTLTATVSSSSATGTMQFIDGTTTLGTTSVVAGVAAFDDATLAVGAHSLTAAYSGDASLGPSTSSPLVQFVDQRVTETSLASSVNPATYGEAVTLTATVAPSSATGKVTFMHGTTSFGSATISNGKAKLPIAPLPVGSHSLTAVYAGDTNDYGSTSAALDEVIVKAPTETTLTSSVNPSNLNQTVTLTAAVLPVTATGTVTFYHGSTSMGTATLSGGKAKFSTAALTAGTHSLTATYRGDANDDGSTSPAINQTVD